MKSNMSFIKKVKIKLILIIFLMVILTCLNFIAVFSNNLIQVWNAILIWLCIAYNEVYKKYQISLYKFINGEETDNDLENSSLNIKSFVQILNKVFIIIIVINTGINVFNLVTYFLKI